MRTCISRILLILAITGLSYSCNRINEVEVQVVDVESKEGIEGVNVFYGEEQYVTDENGLVTIDGRTMQGREVSINRDIKGYITEGFSKDCQYQQVYIIEDEIMQIRLEKLRLLKLDFQLNDSTSERNGCYVLDDLEKCEGQFALNYHLDRNGFKYPGLNNVKGSIITFYMVKSSIPWTLSLFYNMEGGCEVTSAEPDQIEKISMNPNSDTTFYTVNLP